MNQPGGYHTQAELPKSEESRVIASGNLNSRLQANHYPKVPWLVALMYSRGNALPKIFVADTRMMGQLEPKTLLSLSL